MSEQGSSLSFGLLAAGTPPGKGVGQEPCQAVRSSWGTGFLKQGMGKVSQEARQQ